ncbi:MAG: hypothetical protein K0S47_1049 [Herbinix sp.]|jgi:hypothetical protein|nr:hypothetical protein [Herbinix sp.]
MNKDNYKKSIDQLPITPDFNERTARIMKKVMYENKKSNFITRKLVISIASAALIITTGAMAFHYANLTPSKQGTVSENSITIAKVAIGENSGKSRMMPLFVYQGRVYLHYNTAIATTDGYTVTEEDMLNLRGEYLGKTIGSIDEWSKQDDYATEFASTIGEGEVYTVKGYDSKYRLMVYTKYEGGFSCEIFDSYGGLTLNTGADYFDLLDLKDHAASYQWESYNSWNNGMNERVDAVSDEAFDKFLDSLYASVPEDITIDMFTEKTDYDSQKFIYVRTKDNLITTLRLFKDGYVYAPEVGFFQVDKTVFDDFYNSLPVNQ